MNDDKATGERPLVMTFIGVFLFAQILAPLSYYVGDDRADERFAWRMFSAVRMTSCKTTAWDVAEDGHRQHVSLTGVIHAAWISNINRDRVTVIERYLERRCREPKVAGATVRNVCQTPEGQRFELTRTIDCETGEIERDQEAQ